MRAVAASILGLSLALSLPAFADPDHEPGTTDFAASLVGKPKGTPLSGAELDSRTESVARALRCPVCQASTVGDSPSTTARNMKQQVRELLAAGYSEEQVLSYFEASYGEFVRLAPRSNGFGMIVWLGPGVLLLAGVLILVGFFRRRSRRSTAEAAQSLAPAAPSDSDLDPWLNKVRAAARADSLSGERTP